MNIIILGAGQVGGTLARNLEGEDNEITLVDVSKDRLDELHNYLDLRTICGEAAHPDVLAKAGAENAELLIAVTNSDETNMIACQIAWLLFKVPTKIARVRDPSYLKNAAKLFNKEDESALPVDVVISPEQVVTDYIYKLIKYPGALQVLDFANGLVRLVAVRAYYGGPLVGNAIATLRQHMPNVDSRVAAIFRQGRPIVPTGSTIIEANDEVFFIAERNDIMKVISELQKLENPYKKIMIAGGGHIGAGLAHMLEKDGYQVKVIERGEASARLLSAELSGTVINADAADRDMLLEENIEEMDVFVAVTNSDSANIMSSMLARRLSASANEEHNQKNDKNRKDLKVMALINRSEYVDLAQGHEINIAISPQQATIGSLLTYIRQGDIATVYSLRRGAAEALETIAHGDSYTSKVVGRTIEEITLPPGTTIGAIVRGEPGEEKVLIAHDNIVIESDDHVILFLVDKKYVHDVEVMFQVDPTFI